MSLTIGNMDIGCNMDTFPDNMGTFPGNMGTFPDNMGTMLEDMSVVDIDTLWDISIELDMLFEDWPD